MAGQVGTRPPRAVGLLDLPVELSVRVLEHLSSTRDLGRAGCVCCAWRAGDSPVERVLRRRIEAHGGAVSAALPPVAAASMTHRLCLLDSIGAAQAVSGAISLGCKASAAVGADGRLCVWGELSSSSIHGSIISCKEPTVLQTARLERIAVGSDYILALTETRAVLSFGKGGHGHLGHGDKFDQLEPKVIEALRDVRVVAIAAGDSHSMVLTDEGKVLSFGKGLIGELGHGDQEDQLVPKVIEALGDRRVAAIAAGRFHSMVLTDKGAVLSFGKGKFGRLGHGAYEDEDCSDQLVPKVIAGTLC